VKAQISNWALAGIFLVLTTGLIMAFVAKQKMIELETDNAQLVAGQAPMLQAQIEACLYDAMYEVIFGRIGPQGGYVDPDMNEEFGDYDIVPYENSAGSRIPYWYIGGNDISPSIEQIEEKIERYVAVRMLDCDDFSQYALQGITIEPPPTNYMENRFGFIQDRVDVDISLNREEVSVKYIYPITVSKDRTSRIVSEYYTTIPVALGPDLILAKQLLAEMAANGGDYNLAENSARFSRKGYTNIYPLNGRILFIDYGPYFDKKIEQSLKLQFAFSDINIYGYCSG